MQKLPERIVSLYRGWKEWSLKNENQIQAIYVLAADLCKKKILPKSFDKKIEIVNEIELILSDFNSYSFENKHIEKYSKEKLSQSLEYIQTNNPKNIGPKDIEKRGMPWILPRKEELEKAKHEFLQAKEKIQSPQKIEHYESFIKDHSLIRPKTIETADYALGLIYEIYPWLEKATYSNEEITVDFPWMQMVTTTNPCELCLSINTLDRLQYRNSWISFLALHEVCGHVLHFTQLMKNEFLQDKAPHFLCISVHTQDAYLVEGVAQLMANLVVTKIEKTKDHHWDYGVKHGNYYIALKHYNLMNIIEGRLTCIQAGKIHTEAFGGDINKNQKIYEKTVNDVFSICQSLAYYHSYQTLSSALYFDDKKLNLFLHDLLTNFYSPHEINILVSKYAEKQIT